MKQEELISATLKTLSVPLKNRRARQQLHALHENDLQEEESPAEEIDWREGASALKLLNDRLGRAGFTGPAMRSAASKACAAALIGGGLAFGAIAFSAYGTLIGTLGGICAGVYCGLTAFLYFLRFKRKDFEREILFQMPIFLESLVLLVEAGLGILPAIEKVVASKPNSADPNPVNSLFNLVYQFSAHGMPFQQSLETVAESTEHRIVRHVMLHLDISGNEGGELVPSLRNLSDHAHTEWRLSVEQRVKRLENLVVFPVFAAVIGLMCLTAAVPMVPILNLKDSLDKQQQILSSRSIGGAEELAREVNQGAAK